jgi:hypothetical protein
MEANFSKAQQRLQRFSARYGWQEFMNPPFIRKARIFDDRPGFDQYLHQVGKVDPAVVFPVTFSAALEEEEFVAVSPELYIKNYPDGDEPDFYEKLITHEMAHRLQVRILRGQEDKWARFGFSKDLPSLPPINLRVAYPSFRKPKYGASWARQSAAAT